MNAFAEERLRFGRYETLFRLAAGGMAEVFVARALGEGGFQKLVALKRMRPELADDARFATMFLDEGRMAANIASPNVVSTLDLGRAEDNSLFLVMELITGVSLQSLMNEARLRHGGIPVPIAVDLIAQAANGLHAAHEARSPTGERLEIVHRDCSPHNILVDVRGQVKITDFGIAKAMERQTRSHAGEMKGKLSYLSPEQARGLPVDRRADIFILGIVAWEAIASRPLFGAENPVEALHKVITMPIPRLSGLNPDVSPEVADVIERALVRDPDERFATADTFAEALLDAYGVRTPPRSAIGEFVRSCGGDEVRNIEASIRAAMGGDATPDPSLPEYPIPLVRAADTGSGVRAAVPVNARSETIAMADDEVGVRADYSDAPPAPRTTREAETLEAPVPDETDIARARSRLRTEALGGSTSATPPPLASTIPPPPANHAPVIGVAAVVVVLGLLLGGGVWWWLRDDEVVARPIPAEPTAPVETPELPTPPPNDGVIGVTADLEVPAADTPEPTEPAAEVPSRTERPAPNRRPHTVRRDRRIQSDAEPRVVGDIARAQDQIDAVLDD